MIIKGFLFLLTILLLMAHNYTVKVVQNEGGKGGSEGRIATLYEPQNTNFIKLQVQSPAEFKGPKDENGKSLYWTPEDLYVSSVAVCLFTTFVSIAENSKLQYSDLEIIAKGFLDKTSEGFMITKIEQKVVLTIPDEKNKAKAERIVEKSEKNCLIANSIKTEVSLEVEIKISQ